MMLLFVDSNRLSIQLAQSNGDFTFAKSFLLGPVVISYESIVMCFAGDGLSDESEASKACPGQSLSVDMEG